MTRTRLCRATRTRDVDELEHARKAAQQLGDDGLVLDRVERTRRVDEGAADGQHGYGATRNVELQLVQTGKRERGWVGRTER